MRACASTSGCVPQSLAHMVHTISVTQSAIWAKNNGQSILKITHISASKICVKSPNLSHLTAIQFECSKSFHDILQWFSNGVSRHICVLQVSSNVSPNNSAISFWRKVYKFVIRKQTFYVFCLENVSTKKNLQKVCCH